MQHFTDYQLLVITSVGFMDIIASVIVWFVVYALIRYDGFRRGATEAIQDGDEKFHWMDAKNVSYLVAGFLCALFTMHIAGILMYAKMFDTGPMLFLGLFVAATFSLLGIAWKK